MDGMDLDIIAFVPTGDYEGNTRRRMLAAVARELERRGHGEKMLCVERPVCPISTPIKHPRKFAQWAAGRRRLRQVAPNVWAWTPTVFIHDIIALRHYSLRRANNWALRATLQRVLSVLQMHESDSQLVSWVFHPFQADHISLVLGTLRVYECYDDYAAWPHVAVRPRLRDLVVRLEKDVVGNCDVVFTTAAELRDRLSRDHPHVFWVPNGADIQHFAGVKASLSVPSDMGGIGRPRLLFLGSVNDAFDPLLLFHVAGQRPDWQFVVVGAVRWTAMQPQHRRAISELAALTNVHFMGPRPYQEVPPYVHAADACLIPFFIEGRTTTVYPNKLHEYLAAGKPVVSTPFGTMDHFARVVYLAPTPEAFERRIERAMAEDCAELQQKRIAVAKANSWDVRAREILLHIEEAAEDR